MPVRKVDAIKNFLTNNTHKDLADLYNSSMEVQVNVAKGEGERVSGEWKGKKFVEYTDGENKWKAFRIPRNAYSKPEYDVTSELYFDLEEHAEDIGMTGWDWKNLVSRWVAFDFDSIIEHEDVGLTPEQLTEVQNKATELDYTTIRSSTSGNGIHIYVFFAKPVPTQNHNEHAALARATLNKLSFDVGCDFSANVDVCGGNMWVWGRRMQGSTDGLALIRQGIPLVDSPSEELWKSNMPVVERRRARASIVTMDNDQDQEEYDQTARDRPRVTLDEEHKRIISALEKDQEFVTYYEQEEQRLITHTLALKKVFMDLGLKGIFDTGSSGSTPQNCFAYPLRRGGWFVLRYGKGVQEVEGWESTANGWTQCQFNMQPAIRSVCLTTGGVETPKGDFEYSCVADMIQAAEGLGVTIENPNLPTGLDKRAWLSETKDGRLLAQFDAKGLENSIIKGWAVEKGKFSRIYGKEKSTDSEALEVQKIDGFLRKVVTVEKEDYCWAYKPPNMDKWCFFKRDDIRSALYNRGYKKQEEVQNLLGSCINNPWELTNEPFKPEYPGNRRWNMKRVMLKYPIKKDKDPDQLHYPTWMTILNHVGKNLTRTILKDPWCVEHEIKTGGEYLKVWCAWMFQKPKQRLPYLFFYSLEQHTGKSTFHEQLGKLMTDGGSILADGILTGDFGDELLKSVLCAVEEFDLASNKNAYNKVKAITTSDQVRVRPMYSAAANIDNITHWVQTSNKLEFLPIEPNDTRVVVAHVEGFGEGTVIRTQELNSRCAKEASDFLTALLTLELPKTPEERMALSVLHTQEKEWAEMGKESVLESYIRINFKYLPGTAYSADKFINQFRDSLSGTDRGYWSSEVIKKNMPPESYPRGRYSRTKTVHFGNLAPIDSQEKAKRRLYLTDKGNLAILKEEEDR